MKLIFHGAAREVGRSCIEVKTDENRFLFDCGLKLTEHESEYPVGFDKSVNDISAVFISHAHLDHTGALPKLDHKGMNCPIYMTQATKALTRLILRDAFKVGKITHQHLGYDKADIKNVIKCISRVKVGIKGKLSNAEFEFFDAGHIPGSSSIFLKTNNHSILYTGDMKNSPTLLHNAADTNFPEIDTLICESTYGAREHTSRPAEDQKLVKAIKETLQNGGTAIVPVFALGRSQEIIMLLAKENFKVPIFFDGMSNVATEITLENPDSLRDFKALSKAFSKVSRIKKENDRFEAVKKQSIIVTTSGMLTGGPIMFYLKRLASDSKNSILITGYQAEGTNGRMLLEKGEIFADGWRKRVRARVEQFDFSAHSGESDLKALVRKVKPKRVFFVHGEEESVLHLQEWAEAIGIESYAPKLGQVFDINN